MRRERGGRVGGYCDGMGDALQEGAGLLCERCGYPLSGLEGEPVCPECGLAVTESMPERRVGTAWQRGASVRAYLRTAIETLVRRRATFHDLRLVVNGRMRWLLVIHFALATIAPVVSWVVFHARFGSGMVVWYQRSMPQMGGMAADVDAFAVPRTWAAVAIGAGVVPLLLLVLTWIETRGVRFFGKRRGWRVTGPIAWSVCAHAGIGWVIGSLVYALSPLAVIWLRPVYDLFPATTGVRVATEAATWAPIAAFVVGMLAFESLVYVGIRACRYANEPRAD